MEVKRYRFDKFINGVIYLLPFIYMDRYGTVYLISILSLLRIYKIRSNKVNLYSDSTDENRKRNLLIGIAAYVIGVIILLNLNKFNYDFSYKGIVFIPNYSFAYFMLVPLIWMKINKMSIKDNLFSINFKTLKFSFYVCFPIIFYGVIMGLFTDVSMVDKHGLVQEIFQAIITAAITEEIFFRGFLYQILKQYIKPEIAQIIVSILFTCTHITLMKQLFQGSVLLIGLNILAIFLLGIVNCKIYDKCKSLIPAIILHSLVNGALRNLILLIRVL